MSDQKRPGLSRGAEVLVRLLEEGKNESFDCDVLIVGSGYGGAVAAARLAGSTVNGSGEPARVWLLERGREYAPGHFPSRFSELPGHVRFNTQKGGLTRGRAEGLFDLRIGGDVSALLGNGLGGGSLINAGVMEPPDADVFVSGWPHAITLAGLAEGYQRAHAMIGPQSLRDDPSRRWAAFEAVASANGTQAKHCNIAVNLGAPTRSAAGVPMAPCTRCGDCITGCNQGAKGSLDTNYLAWAQARGVEMFCGGAVEHLLPAEGGLTWSVTWHFTDPTRRLPGADPRPIRARHVVLAAGSFGSTEILMRSRLKGLSVPGELGKRFSANGDFLAAGVRHREPVEASADQESDPADPAARRVGPTITGLARGPKVDGQLPFVVEEFSVPGALRQMFGELASTLHAFAKPSDSRDANGPTAVTDMSIAHCSLYGAMGDDGAAGRLVLPADIAAGSVEGALGTVWKHVTSLPVFEAQEQWLNNGLTPLCESDEPVVPHPLHAFELGALTVHPLGGCAMGTCFADGVVDAEGRLFCADTQTHRGLVVLDGSIVPRALGINPALTIAALAERALPLLTVEWGLMLAPDAHAEPAPRVPARRRELPPSGADWVIRERLHGPMVFGDTTVWASINIELEPIPGFAKALGLATRVVGVRRATLEVWSAPAGDDAFLWIEKNSRLLGTADLAGCVRLFEPNPVPGEPPLRLMYQLSVQSLSGNTAGLPIRVGGRLEGIKLFGQPFMVTAVANPWRQLTEIEVRYDGNVGKGRLSLDFDDLADQREPLLRLLRLSSMPDALGDMGTLLLYVLRQTFQVVHQMLGNAPSTLKPHHLSERFPQDLPECKVHQEYLAAGARLTRYAPEKASKLPPVLLIHGLGTSGSSFAHACMPNNLVHHLRNQDGRDVWVLDLRSSVANEAMRHQPEAAEWTVDSVAQADIPAAIAKVLDICKDHQQVDVVAHCMGAVMFCSAALSCPAMQGKVRSVVLSQVGPLARLSPLNRLRGYMATYLQQFLGIDEFDTSPEWVSREDDHAVWERSADTPASRMFRDLLPNTFPYPDDDTERAVHASRGQDAPDFRAVRHRADAIFGQLFELKNLGDGTLDHLDALFGWVKVKMLAQAIHFARHNMLTNSQGRNSWMTQDNFAQRFAFPVLMVHGRRNRVFDWRGSLDSLKALKAMRGEDAEALPLFTPRVTTYGAGTPTQLAVIDGYGHLDCIIGKDAHTDVFPSFSSFFASAGKHKSIGSVPPSPTCEEPWVGPMLGWLRSEETDHGRLLRVNLLLHPSPRRADTSGVALVPMAVTVNGLVPNFTRARVLYLSGSPKPSPHLSQLPADLRNGVIELALNAGLLGDRFDTFAVATLHDDAPRISAASQPDVAAMFARREWLMGSAKPKRAELAAIKRFFTGEEGVAHLRICQFSLGKKVRAAADAGFLAEKAQPLTFAVASCQYPPGLMDEVAAGASYARMSHDAESKDGPQFALLIGDQIYVDATAGVFEPTVVSGTAVSADPADYDRAYQLNWRLPPLRRTVAHIPVLAMLDDHEVSNDWQPLPGGPTAPECTALEAYQRYQQVLNPQRPFSTHSPRSVAVFPSGVGFWVLDTRTQREARQVGQRGPFCAVENAHIVPEQALHDLCAALKAAPPEQVKFIVSPSPILPPEPFDAGAPEERLRSDTWAGYPASTSMLLRFIRDKDIRRVVFLAGDAHLSSVCTFAFEGGRNRVVSVVSSGLYTPWPFANQRPDELVLEGPVDLGQGNNTCRGTVTLHALSQQSGYAIVSVVATHGVHTALRVSLRTASGSDTASDIPLA